MSAKVENAGPMPGDTPEMETLKKQHRMWSLFYGGNGLFPEELSEQVLARIGRTGSLPAVLDIGSGSGLWARDMALTYPHAEVVGFDYIENLVTTFPKNCRVVAGDMSEGLPAEFHARFDIVHSRSILSHVHNVSGVLKMFSDCLKPGKYIRLPGGILLIPDADFQGAWDENKQLVSPARSAFSAWQRTAQVTIGPHFNQPFEERVAWMQGPGAFEGVKRRDYYAPLGWKGEGMTHGEELCEIMLDNIKTIVQVTTPLRPRLGWSEKQIDELIERMYAEITDPSSHLYMKWYVAWGIKLN